MTKESKGVIETTAKDFFLYLAFAVTLIWFVTSFITGSFGLIDAWFPDPLDWHYYGPAGGIMSSLASLLVITPVFLAIAAFINKDLSKNPAKKNLWVRRWLLYAVLFIAFIVTVADLAIVLNSFLQGELTVRFALKTLAVFLVAAAVFGYFFFDLKRDVEKSSRVPLLSAVGVVAATILLAAAIFSVVGSPAEQRAQRLDAERIYNLQDLAWRIDGYVDTNDDLPQDLTTIRYYYNDESISDPESGEFYEYRLLEEGSFEICAVFTGSSEDIGRTLHKAEFVNLTGPASWEYEPGESCFEFAVK